MPNLEKICFVISPIGEDVSLTRKRSDQIFKHVIKPAVETFGYTALRADSISKPGIITTQVIDHLLKSELVIVDLTEKNPNVFYELGIRHSVRKHVIQIADPDEIIPFDIGNVRTIKVDYKFVDSMEYCKKEIIKQIKAIENDKVDVESPVTFALNLTNLGKDNTNQENINIQLISEIQNLRGELDSIKRRAILSAHDTEDWERFPIQGSGRPLLAAFTTALNRLSEGGKIDVKYNDLVKELEKTGLFLAGEADQYITRMLNEGMIYEPREGYLRK